MKPYYQTGVTKHPDMVFAGLMELNWLEVTEARKEYFMSDEPRSYRYGTPPYDREYQSSPYSDTVKGIQTALNEIFERDYNVCFLNRYDTQQNQLGWHADDSPTMDHDHPIAVVSFGAAREIWWKPKDQKGVVPPEQRQLLADNSLFVMPGGFQRDHLHRIPKADRAVGCRISLTFRRYKTELTEEQKLQLNEAFLNKLNDPNDPGAKEAAALLNDYTRLRLRADDGAPSIEVVTPIEDVKSTWG